LSSFKTDKHSFFKRKLIKHLYFEGMLSCSDLSVLTRKSLPFTTKYLNDLIAGGHVIETGFAHSTGGRRPQVYSLRHDMQYIVSVSMDQLITQFAVLDMHNSFVGETRKMELPLQNNPEALPMLGESLFTFIRELQIDARKISGIGIGMPGFVDVKKGINHSFLLTNNESIVNYLELKTELPVLIDNDSSLIGLAELRLGAARGHKNVMVINIGWGVGLGMILNGEMFRGHNGFAGEFSHIPVFKNHKICSCGKTGCLETETSLLVIIEKAINGLANGRLSVIKNLSLSAIEASRKAIMDAAIRGDTFAVELFSEAGYNLGLGIAILIHLLNPELIVLSGQGATAGKLWLAPIQQAINEHCIPKIAEDTQIQISAIGPKAGLMGAAALVMENYETKLVNFNSHINALAV
jgi:glucokinase-like ROK family protein